MAAKVTLRSGALRLGEVTIFDAEPDFDILLIAFPEAVAILHDYRTDHWTVDVGDSMYFAHAD